MLIYVIIIGLIVLAELVLPRRLKLEKEACFKFILFLIVLIVGLRASSVGPDTAGYMRDFTNFGRLPFIDCLNMASRFEYGFQILIWAVYRLIPNATVFLLICAAFSFWCVYKWIISNCNNHLFALYIFFCVYITFYMTGLRQCLAMSVLLLSYKYLRELSLIKFVLLVLLAGQFHSIAYFFIFAYPLILIKKHVRLVQIVLLICIPLVYFLRVELFTLFSSFIYKLFSGFSHYGITTINDKTVYNAFLYLVAIFIILFAGKVKEHDPAGNSVTVPASYGNLYLFGCVLLPFSGLNGSFNRIPMLYCMYMCILLPNVIGIMQNKLLKMAANAALHIVLAVMLLGNVYQSSYSYVMAGFGENGG